QDYPKNRHPGWSRGWGGYHADDGKLFHGSGVGEGGGPRCYKGDVMGCGIMFPRGGGRDSEGDSDDASEPRGGKVKVRNVMYLEEEEEDEEGGEEEEEEDGEDME
ncbi:SPRY3 protein, partial [Pteruthius melanotis]|nr:SPRY3 protein [Pteruthius melanotis]